MGFVSHKLLAIETVDFQGSIALWEEGRSVLKKELPSSQRSAQSLCPAIHQALETLNWKPQELDLVAVAQGPGSFTGLRVGMTTAKMFAWSIGAPLIGVNTLEALAIGLSEEYAGCVLSVAVDAQRGDVAAQRFLLGIDSAHRPWPLDLHFQVIPASTWLHNASEKEFVLNKDDVKNAEEITGLDFGLFYPQEEKSSTKPFAETSNSKNNNNHLRNPLVFPLPKNRHYFCGPILERLKKEASESLCCHFVPPLAWFPSADQVAKIAWLQAKSNMFDNIWSLMPLYSRKSAAEEKLEKNQI